MTKEIIDYEKYDMMGRKSVVYVFRREDSKTLITTKNYTLEQAVKVLQDE
jgi:hypothetical protein